MLFNAHTHHSSDADLDLRNCSGDSVIPPFYHSRGVHPYEASATFPAADLWLDPRCLAVGECGLDKRSPVSFEVQRTCFEQQILLSEKLDLPLILHCVQSWNEVLALRKKLSPQQTWIFHGFRKTKLAPQVLSEGLMLGIGSAVLHDVALQALVRETPVNRLLPETDDRHDGSIRAIYEQIAALKMLPFEVLEKEIETNFVRIFTRWKIG